MDRHTFELLEASVQEAEDAWRSGNRQQAWEHYRSILKRRLEQVGYNPATLTAAAVARSEEHTSELQSPD